LYDGNPIRAEASGYDFYPVPATFAKLPELQDAHQLFALESDADKYSRGTDTRLLCKIDPGHGKTDGASNNFTNWKHDNGFDAGDEAHVVYYNDYDLGFGRDMHMKSGGLNGACPNCVAYYVTNYHNAEDAAAQASPIATVAMEFSPPPGATNPFFTKFYVLAQMGRSPLRRHWMTSGQNTCQRFV
jgi:hypothetical protein